MIRLNKGVVFTTTTIMSLVRTITDTFLITSQSSADSAMSASAFDVVSHELLTGKLTKFCVGWNCTKFLTLLYGKLQASSFNKWDLLLPERRLKWSVTGLGAQPSPF